MKRWYGKPTLTGPPTPPAGWTNSPPLSPPWAVSGTVEYDDYLEETLHSFATREEAVAFIESIPAAATQ